jgi:2-dehydro-3-deoxygluconokinase
VTDPAQGLRPDLVTFGETMAVLRSQTPGPLQHNDCMQLSCAGAESTVAIGLARLGHHAVWVGRTGDDELGELVRSSIRGAGVEISCLVDQLRPTGLLLRSARTASLTRVNYYRRGSAGSAITGADLVEPLSRRPRIVHATGITPALGAGARTATIEALGLAREAGALISYDINFRSRLTTLALAARVTEAILEFVSVLFCGEDELVVLTEALGMASAAVGEIASALPHVEFVVKRGSRGAIAHVDAGAVAVDAVSAMAVDVVGAGDAFVAGYLSAHLDGLPIRERLSRAAVLGAFVVSSPGDWEGLPTRAELGLFDSDPDFTDR